MIARSRVGSCDVTVLEVLTARRSAAQVAGLFDGVQEEEVESLTGGEVLWSFNLLLLSFDGVTVLVDTGFSFSPGGNGAPTSSLLAEAGVEPGDIGLVVVTHAHGDHIGGLLVDGARAFPEAELVISRPEHAFWTGREAEELGDDRVRAAREALDAYRGRTRIIEPGAPIWETGSTVVRSIDAAGHTPGHMGLEVVSGGARLWALVDTLHTEAQLSRPEWSPRFDVDPDAARVTRRRLLERVSADGIPVHFFHLAFPGFGRVRPADGRFAWEPTEV